MKELEEVIKAMDCHYHKDWDCDNCPYVDVTPCISEMNEDMYLIAIKEENKRLKEENERLIKRMDSENNKDEVIKCLSDTSKDLLKYIHVLKEDIKALREQNEKFMEQCK